MSQSLSLVILAGGQGKRFLSVKNKVLHELGGRPILTHILEAAAQLNPDEIVLVTSPQLQKDPELGEIAASYPNLRVATQEQAGGTADALLCAFQNNAPQGDAILTLLGDVPLITSDILHDLQKTCLETNAKMGLISMSPPDPFGYGRCLTDEHGRLMRIVEEREASEAVRSIPRCNSGLWWLDRSVLPELAHLKPSPKTGEVYLTDLVKTLHQQGHTCIAVDAPYEPLLGINTRADLAHAEALYQQGLRQKAMTAGATLRDPSSVFLSFDTKIAPDVTIEPFVTIGPGVCIESGATIHAYSYIRATHVGKNATVGPFASLSNNTRLDEGATMGSFVEGKRLVMGKHAKAKHLSYLGDANIEQYANIGAGVITCNYDGTQKHKTHIGQRAFVGANTSLVAPLAVGPGAVVGAGSVIVDDVPSGSLALGRARQVIKKVKKKACAES